MGNFNFSELDDRSIRDNFQQLKQEFSKMQSFVDELDRKWKDEQKSAFYNKYLRETLSDAQAYLKSYEELVSFIDQKKNTNPNFYK
jgi:uncharacterized protein YukE